MSNTRKTVIVTGASQGIGAGIVRAFVARGDNVVATSRKVTQSTEVTASDRVALVDGDIGDPTTAAKVVETARSRFRSIDALVNNAGIFFTKPFTEYTVDDFRSLVSTNLEGFLYVTQLAVKQMLAQQTGGSIVTISAALARNPIRGVHGGGADDHQRRPGNGHAAPGDGVRQRRHPRERRRARRRRHAVAPGDSDGGDGESVADGSAFDGQGDRGRGPVPDRRRDGDGSDLVRRWRCSFRPLVMGWSVRHDVPVRWSCRTGVCHTCECGLIPGSVSYDPEPLEPPADGNLLTCCSRPRKDLVIDI